MTEAPNATPAEPVAPTSQGGEPTPNAGSTQGEPPAGNTDPSTWDSDRASATIKAQRESEKKLKQQLADAQAKVEAAEREKLTAEQQKERDLETATKRVAELESQLSELKQTAAFKDAAIAAGVKPKAVTAALAIAGKAGLELDDDGKLANGTELFEQLETEHDYLFGSAEGAGGTPPPPEPRGNPGSGNVPPNDGAARLTAEQLSIIERTPGMTVEKFLANLEP